MHLIKTCEKVLGREIVPFPNGILVDVEKIPQGLPSPTHRTKCSHDTVVNVPMGPGQGNGVAGVRVDGRNRANSLQYLLFCDTGIPMFIEDAKFFFF